MVFSTPLPSSGLGSGMGPMYRSADDPSTPSDSPHTGSMLRLVLLLLRARFFALTFMTRLLAGIASPLIGRKYMCFDAFLMSFMKVKINNVSFYVSSATIRFIIGFHLDFEFKAIFSPNLNKNIVSLCSGGFSF